MLHSLWGKRSELKKAWDSHKEIDGKRVQSDWSLTAARDCYHPESLANLLHRQETAVLERLRWSHRETDGKRAQSGWSLSEAWDCYHPETLRWSRRETEGKRALSGWSLSEARDCYHPETLRWSHDLFQRQETVTIQRLWNGVAERQKA